MTERPVLVVMAAGMGSRYGGLKQIDPVGPNGELIIDYSIFDARRAGFETVIFVINRKIDALFRSAIGDRLSRFIHVEYVYQDLDDLPEGYSVPGCRVKPWGTAHAALAARRLIRGPFVVINADDYYGPESYRLIYDYLVSHPDGDVYEYAMAGYLLKNTVTEHGTVARGVCEVDGNGCLTAVTERTKIAKDGDDAKFTEDDGATWTPLPGGTVVSMNLWGFHRSFLDEAAARFPAFLDETLAKNPEKGEYYLPTVVGRLIAEGKARVKVLTSGDKWYGVTYKEDKESVKAAVRALVESGLYPAPLWGEG